MIHRSPAPGATALCLALLLLFPRTSSTAATGAPNTAAPCAPAWCGDLAISYPFWLAGTHPPKCGHQGFQVTCDKAKAYLKNSVWTDQIQAIFYTNNLLRVTNANLSLDGTCNVGKFVNASSVLRPFYVDSQNDMELFFFYGCNLRAPQLPRSWATGADYQRLMEGGFLLNYLNEDFSQCDACSVGHGYGQCRTFVSDDGLQCYCSETNRTGAGKGIR